jgi:hypothetical protein
MSERTDAKAAVAINATLGKAHHEYGRETAGGTQSSGRAV